jgi:hypothetical protein
VQDFDTCGWCDKHARLQNGTLQRKGSGSVPERDFLIKWHEHSHIRNEWVPESRVMALAKRKLLNFTKKYGATPVDLSNPKWTIPERFVARRKCPYAPGWEVLVKWTGVPASVTAAHAVTHMRHMMATDTCSISLAGCTWCP